MSSRQALACLLEMRRLHPMVQHQMRLTTASHVSQQHLSKAAQRYLQGIPREETARLDMQH